MPLQAFLINRNRLTTTRHMAEWLTRFDVEVIILDNDSSYPPLLQWYRFAPADVIRFNQNFGFEVGWETGILARVARGEFILSDSDLDLSGVPDDWEEVLRRGLAVHRKGKAGLSLEIEGLPDHYRIRDQVVRWESQFWRRMLDADFYDAQVDTTFALYQSEAARHRPPLDAVRARRPYTARHAPWYVDTARLDEEESYYLQHADGASMWSSKLRQHYSDAGWRACGPGRAPAPGEAMKERKRLLVGVTSAAGYEDRRSRCRATWFGDLAADPHVLPFFVIGRPGGDSPVLVGDTLFLPCADDYDSLPQKTLGMIRWALDRWDFDYLFKCDDDTYVHPERLKLFPFEGRDYMGGGPGFASGGAGYFLSREAARAVARRGLPLTGAEDLLVGDVLRQAGFGLHLSDRFVPTKGRAAAPRPDNAVVTTHPILDDMLMATIHREAQATPTPAGFDGAFELLEAITGYGKVGLHGAQGCDVSGGPDALEHEQSPASWQAYCTVSAHAPSALRVRLHRPMSLFMFCDDQAFERPDDPLRFSLNGDPFWEWGRGPRRSPDFRLDPGDHTLAAAVRQNTRAYSAWALRPLGGDGMRIVMPTSNNYVEVAALCLELLERHWPGHPPVDVLHYDRRVPTELPVRQIRVGSQSEVSWIEGIRGYLSSKNSDELILLWLDDYAMCGGADVERVARARRCMASDLSLASFSLTWMMRPPCRPYPGAPDVQVCPCWEYSCHTQAGIWRRLSLLRVLTALSRGSAADFELAGSRYYNRCEAAFEHHAAFLLPDPPVPDLFLDRTDKRFWPLPYHNLMHAGAPDSRHDEFRRQIRA